MGTEGISRVMGKTLVSVGSKMCHLGLSVVDAAATPPIIAVSVASVASTPELLSTMKPVIMSSQVLVIDHPPQ